MDSFLVSANRFGAGTRKDPDFRMKSWPSRGIGEGYGDNSRTLAQRCNLVPVLFTKNEQGHPSLWCCGGASLLDSREPALSRVEAAAVPTFSGGQFACGQYHLSVKSQPKEFPDEGQDVQAGSHQVEELKAEVHGVVFQQSSAHGAKKVCRHRSRYFASAFQESRKHDAGEKQRTGQQAERNEPPGPGRSQSSAAR